MEHFSMTHHVDSMWFLAGSMEDSVHIYGSKLGDEDTQIFALMKSVVIKYQTTMISNNKPLNINKKCGISMYIIDHAHDNSPLPSYAKHDCLYISH